MPERPNPVTIQSNALVSVPLLLDIVGSTPVWVMDGHQPAGSVQASERAASKLAMPITRTNKKAGQSASTSFVYHSTSQRRTEEF